MVNLPIFIMLLGILVSVANLTASTWNYEPTEQTIETLDANTAVTFANPSGEKLAKKGDYEVAKRYVTIKAKRPSTGEIQNIKVLIRKPKAKFLVWHLRAVHLQPKKTCQGFLAQACRIYMLEN